MTANASGGDTTRTPGRIITFYSYKGGTGRSMALANVAWILASNGLQVAVIDWDLEAPGLHRYFRPFLSDPELTSSPGLIDFFVHFTEAARAEARAPQESTTAWFRERADLMRYSQTIDYEFADGGSIDFVSAGQQGPSYGLRVNSFQWGEFYEKLGGGTFLEAVKEHLQRDYDIILIDSRTGLSDTSGICTVQMPSELVVCFTMNRQSIFGAAATAASADAQRRLPNGEVSLKIWPIPTRIEFSETARLDAARVVTREQFAAFLWHLPPNARPDYWSDIEVPYFPYYAFEEVLATIKDQPKPRTSLLTSMERIATRLMQDWLAARNQTEMVQPKLDVQSRDSLLQLFQPAATRPPTDRPRFFVSFASADQRPDLVEGLTRTLDDRFGARSTFTLDRIPLGGDWDGSIRTALEAAEVVFVLVGPRWSESAHSRAETETALSTGKAVIPILLGDDIRLPTLLSSRRAFTLRPTTFREDLARLGDTLEAQLPSVRASIQAGTPVDVDDPHKGQFGGNHQTPQRILKARVTEAANEWFHLTLAVEQQDQQRRSKVPLVGEVEFHLHPTFRPSVVRVPVSSGRAILELRAWGAFTVGAIADDGLTRLELDLATIDAPKVFRER
jgi:hypothetical protein